MPKVIHMEERMRSHMARVSGKALEKEMDRLRELEHAGKISRRTHTYLIASAAIRLAWKANAA